MVKKYYSNKNLKFTTINENYNKIKYNEKVEINVNSVQKCLND